jgi:CHAT domain-containing protein
MRKRLLGDVHIDVARTLNSLAVLHDTQHEYNQAEPLLIEALVITQNVLGYEHPETANCMHNLASLYGGMRRYEEAETILLEALRIRQKFLVTEHPDIALSLNNIANLYFSQGRYQEAEEKYVEVLSIRKRFLGDSHPNIARSLNNLATVFTASNRPEEALSYRVQASLINDKIISQAFAFSSENDRIAFLQRIRANFDLFLSLVCTYLPNSTTAKQEALDFVLKRKALTASALAAQNQAFYSGRYPHLTEKFRELSNLSTELIHLTLSASDVSDFAAYQENLSQLQAKYNSSQKQLASQVPEIKLFQQITDRKAVASALPPNSILVEFVCFGVFNFHAVHANQDSLWSSSRYVAFILPAGQPDALEMVDLGSAQIIDDLIASFRLQASDNNQEEETTGFQKKAAQLPKLQIKPYDSSAAIQLSQALFQPIRHLINGYKHLIFAPDANLNLVPFQILPLDATSTNLLMDEYTINYLGVGRDILRNQIQPQRLGDVPLVIADPDFDLVAGTTEDSATVTQKVTPTVDTTTQDLLSTPEVLLGGGKLSRATGTRFLGESVAKKLKNARLYLDSSALETHLTNNIKNTCPSIMLIATHGLFIPYSKQEANTLEEKPLSIERFSTAKIVNPMMRSGLALAGANTWLSGGKIPNNAGKGFVLAQDIAGLDLWANELTVLSACDTARGDITIGEGVFGLRRAFAVAGTKTLVMSLWKVPDKVTALLMERFFDNLESKMQRAEALQNAQNHIRNITVKELRQSTLGIEILKKRLGEPKEFSAQSKIDCDEDDTPLKHPFYWGAWICEGDTAPFRLG